VPFLFKKLGGFSKNKAGRLLDGRTWDDMPTIHQKRKLGEQGGIVTEKFHG